MASASNGFSETPAKTMKWAFRNMLNEQIQKNESTVTMILSHDFAVRLAEVILYEDGDQRGHKQ